MWDNKCLSSEWKNSYLICWLDSLRILRTSFPLNSSSLVNALILSWRCRISLSSSAIWWSRCLNSSWRSDIRHKNSFSYDISSSRKNYLDLPLKSTILVFRRQQLNRIFCSIYFFFFFFLMLTQITIKT